MRTPSRPWRPLIALLGAALATLPPSGAAAQRPPHPPPASRTLAVLRIDQRDVNVGVDGEGRVTVAADATSDRTGVAVREVAVFRERFTPDDVAAWVTTVRRWNVAVRDSAGRDSIVREGGPGVSTRLAGSLLAARMRIASYATAPQRQLALELQPCPGGPAEQHLEIRASEIGQLLWALERAAAVAREQRPRASKARVFAEHEASCPARPDSANPRPAFPRAAAGSSYELLVTFVVDSAGRPEPATLRAMPGSDARFVASLAAVLPSWRFTPPTVAGRAVRQRTHAAVPFRHWPPSPPVGGPVRIAPAADGTARIAVGPMALEEGGTLAPSELRSYTFDLVPAERASAWADSASALLEPTPATLTRCQMSCYPALAPHDGVGIYFFTGADGKGGLRHEISPVTCTISIDRGYPVTADQAAALIAEVRAAVRAVSDRPRATPRAASAPPALAHEVACPVMQVLKQQSTPQYTTAIGWPAGEEVVARFVVDTAGRVEPTTVRVMPGPSRAAVDSLRALLGAVRFWPAVLGGEHLRQVTHLARGIAVGAATRAVAAPSDPVVDAGHGAVTGIARDAHTGAPAGGATVTLAPRAADLAAPPEPYVVTADAAGRFTLPVVLPGEYRLEVRYAAFAPARRDLVVHAGRLTSSGDVAVGPR